MNETTMNLPDALVAEQARCREILEHAIEITALLQGQEPLGAEFEAIWEANLDTLYHN